MIENALAYPREGEEWVKTIVIGGILTLLGFLLVPLFLVYGYIVRAIASSIRGEPTPPVFEDWGGLLVDGVKAWAISFVYLLPAAVVTFLALGGSVEAVVPGGPGDAGPPGPGSLTNLVAVLVVTLVFGYIAVAAIVNFAREGSFSAGFDFATLRLVLLDSDFAVAWALSILLLIVAGILAGIPLVGFVLGPLASFYAGVAGARLWAHGYSDALGLNSPDTVAETP